MESLAVISPNFRGKRVLVTGHTGFKGSWLALDAGKSEAVLGVAAGFTLGQAVEGTLARYHAHGNGEPARQLCLAAIGSFERMRARQELCHAV